MEGNVRNVAFPPVDEVINMEVGTASFGLYKFEKMKGGFSGHHTFGVSGKIVVK